MKFRLSESQFQHMLTEMVQEVLLLEASKVHSYKNRAIRYLLSQDLSKELSENYVNRVLKQFYDYGTKETKLIELLPLVCRIAFESGWGGVKKEENNKLVSFLENLLNLIKNFPNEKKQSEIINIIKDTENDPIHKIKYRQLSIDELQDVYNKYKKEFDELSQTKLVNRNDIGRYQVIPIKDMEQCFEYAEYSGVYNYETNDFSGILCFSTHEDKWNEFTNNEKSNVYLLLRNDWEKTLPVKVEKDGKTLSIHGTDGRYGEKYTAYDNYGMSMIFVFIDRMSGYLKYSNVRWNHGFGDGVTEFKPGCDIDHAFKKEDIIELLGSDEIFKIEGDFSNLEDVIKSGTKLNEIFDNIQKITDNITYINIGSKSNWLLNDKCETLWGDLNNIDSWLDYIDKFRQDDNLYLIGLKHNNVLKYNFYDLETKELYFKVPINEWYDELSIPNYQGWCKVMYGDKMNQYNFNNNQLLYQKPVEEWFNEMGLPTENGICVVGIKKDNKIKYNYYNINSDELLLKYVWFDKISCIDNEGWCEVGYSNNTMVKCNIFNVNTQEFGYKNPNVNEWFNKMGLPSTNGWCQVRNNGNTNFYNIYEQKFLYADNNSNNWFKIVNKVSNRELFIVITSDNLYNFMNKNGNILYKPDNPELWFSSISTTFNTNVFMVKRNDEYNLYNLQEKRFYWNDDWFYDIYSYENTPKKMFVVISKINGKMAYNFITEDGICLWNNKNPDTWFDGFNANKLNIIVVAKNYKYNFLKYDGSGLVWNYSIDNWFDSYKITDSNKGKGIVKLNNKIYYFDSYGKLYNTRFSNRPMIGNIDGQPRTQLQNMVDRLVNAYRKKK